MNCHNLLKNNYHENRIQATWKSVPPVHSWSAVDAIPKGSKSFEIRGFVTLDRLYNLFSKVFPHGPSLEGKLKVGILRSADIAPPAETMGQAALISEKASRRVLRPGDVLVPRVGVTGRAGYVGSVAQPLLAGQELMMIRLKNPGHAPLIAAALSSEHVRVQIAGLTAGATIPTLTRDAIGRILVPDPRQPKAYLFLEKLKETKASISAAEDDLAVIRADVDRWFENTPNETQQNISNGSRPITSLRSGDGRICCTMAL